MMSATVDQSQRRAARVVGATYLLAIVTGCFAEFYVNDKLIAYDNAAETARNIIAHERLFRLGVASNLLTFAADVALITALFVVLKPVSRNLALAAAFWRLIETTSLVAVTFADFDVLRILSGADYLGGFEADRLQALARLSIGAHGAAYNVGLFFFGFGSTVFCYLWYRSRYIPRALAAWGVFSSVLVGACAFAFVIFPELEKIAIPGCYMPIFVFEVAMGGWLLLRGLRSGAAEPYSTSARGQAGVE